MKSITILPALFAAALFGALPAFSADAPKPAPNASAKPKPTPLSPPAKVTAEIGGANVSISYSRPYTKHPKTGEVRKIWGGLVPYREVWRTGANEAAVLTTDKPLQFGSVALPAGSYSVWTIPNENGGKLVFNTQTGQWGTQHDAAKDFASVELKRAPLSASVDQFTIELKSTGSNSGSIALSWENASYSADFTVGK